VVKNTKNSKKPEKGHNACGVILIENKKGYIVIKEALEKECEEYMNNFNSV
jgi:hypothetical protein